MQKIKMQLNKTSQIKSLSSLVISVIINLIVIILN